MNVSELDKTQPLAQSLSASQITAKENKLIAEAKQLEAQPGYKAAHYGAPAGRLGMRSAYPPCGPDGFPLAPRTAEVLVPMNVLRSLKDGHGASEAAVAASSETTSAPSILDYPWYNYLSPQP